MGIAKIFFVGKTLKIFFQSVERSGDGGVLRCVFGGRTFGAGFLT
jgi:hypothetical protein